MVNTSWIVILFAMVLLADIAIMGYFFIYRRNRDPNPTSMVNVGILAAIMAVSWMAMAGVIAWSFFMK